MIKLMEGGAYLVNGMEIIEGTIYIKGSIQLFPIGIIALKVYRNKQVRKYINKIKN